MSREESSHLSQDLILMAVVDEQGQPASVREHFAACASCREQREGLVRDLEALGEMAGRHTPAHEPKIVLPARMPEPGHRFAWDWRHVFAAAAVVALAVLVVWDMGVFTSPVEEVGSMTPMRAGQNHIGEPVLAEETILPESALPEEYVLIAGESCEGMNEDFMEFPGPDPDDPDDSDETLSYDREFKGAVRC